MKKSNLYFLITVSLILILSTVSFAETVVIKDILNGDQSIIVDSQLLGIIYGNVIVSSGVSFQLDGIVSGNVTIQEGASVVVNGIVEGSIINDGGTLEISGIVKDIPLE